MKPSYIQNFNHISVSRRWTVLIVLPVLIYTALNLTLGWMAGADFIVRALPGLPAMVPGTAISLLLLAVSQVLLVLSRPAWQRYALLCVAGTVLGATVSFSLNVSDLRIDADRMSVATLTAIVLIAVAQCLTVADRPRRLREASGLIVAVIAIAALIGYLTDSGALSQLVLFRGLSVPTSISVLLLGIGAILAKPQGTSMAIVVDPGVGGRVARRYIPWALLAPIGLGELSYAMIDSGVVDGRLSLLSFTTVLVVASCAAVFAFAFMQAEQERKDIGSRENLRAVLSGLNEAIFVFDTQGRSVGRNRSGDNLFQVDVNTLDQLQALPLHGVPDRSELTGSDHPVARVLDGAPNAMAGWMDHQGQEHVLRFSSFRTSGSADAFQVVVAADVTEPWMLQQTVAQTERANALAQLVSGVSHEMLNIFGVIKMAAGSAEAAAPKPVGVVIKAANRGSGLAERLQRLTIAHNGAVQTVDAGDSVRSAVELARRSMPARVTLTADLSDMSAPVACEPSDLELALLNLILNARNAINEAGQPNGQVSVSLNIDGGQAVIEVEDNGPGIPEDLMDRVRRPFFTTRRDKGGTGLGLAMVGDFTAKNGGQFDLGPGAVGGTLARVTLPLTDGVSRSASDDALQSLDGISVVVADGDPDVLSIVADTLMMLGAKVARAERADDAMKAIGADPSVAVLLTDHALDGSVSGGDLAAQAKTLRPGLGLIYMSGGLGHSEPAKVGVPGMTLAKPINMAHLSNAVLRAAGAADQADLGGQ